MTGASNSAADILPTLCQQGMYEHEIDDWRRFNTQQLNNSVIGTYGLTHDLICFHARLLTANIHCALYYVYIALLCLCCLCLISVSRMLWNVPNPLFITNNIVIDFYGFSYKGLFVLMTANGHTQCLFVSFTCFTIASHQQWNLFKCQKSVFPFYYIVQIHLTLMPSTNKFSMPSANKDAPCCTSHWRTVYCISVFDENFCPSSVFFICLKRW